MIKNNTNIAKNLLRSAIKSPIELDFLAISLFLKLKFVSSDFHFSKINDISNFLGISRGKFDKLRKNPRFDDFFYMDRDHIVASCIRRRGEQITVSIEIPSDVNVREVFVQEEGYMGKWGWVRKRIENNIPRKNDPRKVKIYIGKAIVCEFVMDEKFNIKILKKYLRKIAIADAIADQELKGHSDRVSSPTGNGNVTVKNAAGKDYVGCSYRRMSEKTGIGLTDTKSLIKEMIRTGMIKRDKRVYEIARWDDKSMTKEQIDAQQIRFMSSINPEPGSKIVRRGSSILLIRSNIYTIAAKGDLRRTRKRYKNMVTLVNDPKTHKMRLYAPDRINGVIQHDSLCVSDGEILRSVPRIHGNWIGDTKQNRAKTRWRERFINRIVDTYGEEGLKRGAYKVIDAIGKMDNGRNIRGWISPEDALVKGMNLLSTVLDHQKGYNKQCVAIGCQKMGFDEAWTSVVYGQLIATSSMRDAVDLFGDNGLAVLQLYRLDTGMRPSVDNILDWIGVKFLGEKGGSVSLVSVEAADGIVRFTGKPKENEAVEGDRKVTAVGYQPVPFGEVMPTEVTKEGCHSEHNTTKEGMNKERSFKGWMSSNSDTSSEIDFNTIDKRIALSSKKRTTPIGNKPL